MVLATGSHLDEVLVEGVTERAHGDRTAPHRRAAKSDVAREEAVTRGVALQRLNRPRRLHHCPSHNQTASNSLIP